MSFAAAGQRAVSAKPAAFCRLRVFRGTPQRHFTMARVVAAAGAGSSAAGGGGTKTVWLSTNNQDVLTAALEAGVQTVVFDANQGVSSLAQEWQQLGRFRAISRTADGRLLDAVSGTEVGRVRLLASPSDLRAAEAEATGAEGVVVMDATDWQIIPAENLVAAYQHNSKATLLAAAPDYAASRVMLEALQAGTDGVLLRTDDPAEVRALMSYLREREQEGAARLQYETATVTAVRPVGMGDRACVDLCSLLQPGEGMLVGSFSRALFLVHSECAESKYIASRPFRVNAGPVHAYLQLPAGRTGYLSELQSGAEVLVAGPGGTTRTALVGRVKIETRPLVLVEAELPDGDRCSVLLQNAETVRLVGPAERSPSSASSRQQALPGEAAAAAADDGYVWQQGDGASGSSSSSSSRQQASSTSAAAAASAAASATPPSKALSWRVTSVSELAPGQQLYVLRQGGARHTGVAIQESIRER